MSEEKKEIKLFSGINKDLLREVSEVAGKYSAKEIYYTLWYVLTTISVSIFDGLEKKRNE